MIDGVLITRRLSFARFTNDHCNYGTYAIGNNPLSPDAVHPMQMTATSKYNVHLNSLAFFYEPDPEWIVQEVCHSCNLKYNSGMGVHMYSYSFVGLPAGYETP